MTVRLPRQLVTKAKVFCAVNGIDLQDAISEGLEFYLCRQMNSGRPAVQPYSRPDSGRPAVQPELAESARDKLPDENLAVQPSTHDDDDERERENLSLSSSSNQSSGRPAVLPSGEDDRKTALLNFYVELTGNPVKAADWNTLSEIAHCSDAIIKAGIREAVLRCKTRVNSLKYCVRPILELAQLGPDTETLDYLESKPRARRLDAVQPNLPGVGAELVNLGAARSRYPHETRRAYADAKGMGDGWMNESKGGKFDPLVTDWLRVPEKIDPKKCLDCEGEGYIKKIYFEEDGRYVKCSHSKLREGK